MDGFSILDGSWRKPLTEQREYDIGNAIGWLSRGDKQAATHHALSGRLYVAKSGWLLLSVPNALVRGVYDAMTAPGAELPLAGTMNVPNVASNILNAHISVMTADEVKKIGAENINERGHMVGYSLGHLKEITPRNVEGVSKVWALQVSAPMLSAIRKSYGLQPFVNGHPFHITVAVRRKNVLQSNGVRKAAADLLHGGEADNMPDSKFPKKELAEGVTHEHEHTDNDQIAKEIAKDHLQEDAGYYEKIKEIEPKSAASLSLPLPKQKDPKEQPAASTAPPEPPPPPTNDKLFGVVPPLAVPQSGQKPQIMPMPGTGQKQAQSDKDIIAKLREAKEHSDNKRYGQKTDILRRLMSKKPDDWKIDDSKPYHKGVTHTPTNFKFHVEPTAIPASVKAAFMFHQTPQQMRQQTRRSDYATALQNTFSLRRPIVYNYNKTVAENIHDQLLDVKNRGQFMRQARQNHQRYMSALDPNYRFQLAMKAMNNEMDEDSPVDQMIDVYGENILGTMFGGPK